MKPREKFRIFQSLEFFLFLLQFHSECTLNSETAEDRRIVCFIALLNSYQQDLKGFLKTMTTAFDLKRPMQKVSFNIFEMQT